MQLIGTGMVRLVGAIPRVQQLLDQPVVIGGLAVMCRLGVAYRATQDLDALRWRTEDGASGLEVLRAAGAEDVDEVGGFVATARGPVRVDVLEAKDSDLDREFTDPTDRLEALAHKWALDTATPLDIVATNIAVDFPARDGAQSPMDSTRSVALVARPGPLVAMKLKASIDRPAAKEATDLLDVVRLMTDPRTVDSVMTEFEEADSQLVDDVAMHARLQFREHGPQTRRAILQLRQPGVDTDLIAGAADFLDGVLQQS